MTTVGELMDELTTFPRHALVSVLVDEETAVMVNAAHEPANYKIFNVEPRGCNSANIQITLGNEL